MIPRQHRKRLEGRQWLAVALACIVTAAVACAILSRRSSTIIPAAEEAAASQKNSQVPRRIVSLAPSITEILFCVGLGNRLVGVTEACDYPAEAQRIPKIGTFTQPNLERILALKPDIVIAANRAPREPRKLLEDNSIRVLVVPMNKLEDVFTATETIARAGGRSGEGTRVVAGLRTRLERVPKPAAQRPRVFLEVWSDPLTAPGRDSFLTEVVELAGGSSITGKLAKEYVHLSADFVLKEDPDVIIIGHSSAGRAQDIGKRIGWSELRAVRDGKVITDIDSSLLLRPGPRLVDAIEQLAMRLRSLHKGSS